MFIRSFYFKMKCLKFLEVKQCNWILLRLKSVHKYLILLLIFKDFQESPNKTSIGNYKWFPMTYREGLIFIFDYFFNPALWMDDRGVRRFVLRKGLVTVAQVQDRLLSSWERQKWPLCVITDQGKLTFCLLTPAGACYRAGGSVHTVMLMTWDILYFLEHV